MRTDIRNTRRNFMFVGAATALAGCGGAAAVTAPPSGTNNAAPLSGNGSLLQNSVNWSTANGRRVVQSNQVPDHDNVGPFPAFACPHALKAVPVELGMPLVPMPLAQSLAIGQSRFGVALNGILLDPAGPWWLGEPAKGWQFEVMSERIRHYQGLDASNGHVQPSGAYHYHGTPQRWVKQLAQTMAMAGPGRPGVDSTLLIGWAADGYPIYRPFVPDVAAGAQALSRELRPSYRLKAGLRPAGAPRGTHDGTFVQDYEYVPGLGDLDECNGKQLAASPEFPNGTYAYFVTEGFPHVPRRWRAQPDRGFLVPLGAAGADESPPQYARWPAA